MIERRRLLSMFGALPAGIKAFKLGTMTLDTDQSTIFYITTNLGYYPDVYGFYIKSSDNDLIPLGSAVKVIYNKINYVPSNLAGNIYAHWYLYKHSTSGNLIVGQYNPQSQLPDANTIRIHRPVSDWKALDTNNNPIIYEWFALALDH